MFTNQAEQNVLALAPETASQAGSGIVSRFRNGAASFDRDESGNVIMMFALMSSIMFGFTGLAVDFGRWVNARDMTVAAMDAAVVAGGRAMQTPPPNSTDAQKIQNAKNVALAYYRAAVRNRIPLARNPTDANKEYDTVSFEVETSAKGQEMMAKGNAYINVPFIALSWNTLLDRGSQNNTAEAGLWPLLNTGTPSTDTSRALFATGAGGNKNLEMSIMLDVSGSMSGQKVADMKLAAKDLIDIVVWTDQSKYWSKVALVPFSADIRLTETMRDAVQTPGLGNTITGELNANEDPVSYKKTLCAAERGGAQKYTAAAPGPGAYPTIVYNTSGSCSTPASSAVVPLSTSKDTLKAKIDALALGGGTAGHLGTAWTYYMLSPSWSSIVGASSAATAFGSSTTKKIAVLMTDGEYNTLYRQLVTTDYTTTTGAPYSCPTRNNPRRTCADQTTTSTNTSWPGAGLSTSTTSASINAASSSAQAVEICTKMKADGIEVYTVGFDLGENQTAINTLASCASDAAHAYTPETGDELRQAFRDIAVKTTKLVLTQ